MEQYKLQVRIGTNEFFAEGPEKAVKEQWREFREALAAVPAAPAVRTQPAATRVDEAKAASAQPISDAGDFALNPRIYSVDRAGVVSLVHKPPGKQSEADAFVLLLYGFRARGDEPTGAASILKGLKKTGFSIDRLDRITGLDSGLYQKGGKRRGGRFSLTNPGIAKAEELLAGLGG